MTFRLVIAACITLAAFFGWTQLDRVGGGALPFDAQVLRHDTVGVDVGKGNLIAVQPWLTSGDYANAATLEAKLDAYLLVAKQQGWLGPKSIVVFPEYIGTWLIASNEKRSVYAERAIGPAMQTLVLSNLPGFIRHYLTAPDTVADKAKWAVFTLKAEQAARDYQAVFSALAKRYAVHIVAGSIVLPAPELRDSTLAVRPGEPLSNISALFAPTGEIVSPLVIKAYPIADELKFIAPGSPERLPVFDTPAGRLGVLICADSWYPPSYAAMRSGRAELLAVPSYSAGDGLWSTPWGGYNGAAAPADVDKADIRRLSEADAWLKYAMAGRAPAAGITAGVNVFLRGDLWDLGSDGATVSIGSEGAQRGSQKGAMVRGAVLTSRWLD